MGVLVRGLCLVTLVVVLVVAAAPARADETSPVEVGQGISGQLLRAQRALVADPAQARTAVDAAAAAYDARLAPPIRATAPLDDDRIRGGLDDARRALDARDVRGFADAHARVWTGLLAGSYAVADAALATGDAATAGQWLALRPARRPSGNARDAALVLRDAAAGRLPPDTARAEVRADVLGSYGILLDEVARDAGRPTGHSPEVRSFTAGLAAGYFAIIAPQYEQERGAAARAGLERALGELRAVARSGGNGTASADEIHRLLRGFRGTAPAPADRQARAVQLQRFLTLVGVEYARGAALEGPMRDVEFREAQSFRNAADDARGDLEDDFAQRDAVKARQLADGLAELGRHLAQRPPPPAATVQASVDRSLGLVRDLTPPEWRTTSSRADFEAISLLLNEVVASAAAGQYAGAERARLEAYAAFETGPEAWMVTQAPDLKVSIEELFWFGRPNQPGLADLLARRARPDAVAAARAALGGELTAAQRIVQEGHAPLAVAANAASIVFREGLEAVLILASLMSSLRVGELYRLRRPLWWGAAAALATTGLTWLLAQWLLNELAGFGVQLEAAVSVLAVVTLLLINDWFFHDVYWTDWLARFHRRKQSILGRQVGQYAALVALGFSSVYREGFESVLFLQALALEGGVGVVMSGCAAGAAATVGLGLLVFRLQARLPFRRLLIATAITIGVALVIVGGNTVRAAQIAGWLPVHAPPAGLVPAWAGVWLGVHRSWEGIGAQVAAAAFVLGNYWLAERAKRRSSRPSASDAQ